MSHAQTESTDSLTYYVYAPGKMMPHFLDAEKKTANNWGARIEVFFGDCTSKFDYKHKEFEQKNLEVFTSWKKIHGTAWREKFEKLRDEEMKRLSETQ